MMIRSCTSLSLTNPPDSYRKKGCAVLNETARSKLPVRGMRRAQFRLTQDTMGALFLTRVDVGRRLWVPAAAAISREEPAAGIEPALPDLRLRVQPVGLPLPGPDQVQHLVPARRQTLREHPAMAAQPGGDRKSVV